MKVLNGLAVTYDRFGRFELAELYYDKALALAPDSADLLNNVGYSLLLRERYEESLVYFDRALASKPSAAIRSIVASNQRTAIDELRVARQQKQKVRLIQASLDRQPSAEQVRGCKNDRTVRISKSGERVHSLVTEPIGHKQAASDFRTNGGGTRCGTDQVRRVSILKSEPDRAGDGKASDFVRLIADGARPSKSVPVEKSTLPSLPSVAQPKVPKSVEADTVTDTHEEQPYPSATAIPERPRPVKTGMAKPALLVAENTPKQLIISKAIRVSDIYAEQHYPSAAAITKLPVPVKTERAKPTVTVSETPARQLKVADTVEIDTVTDILEEQTDPAVTAVTAVPASANSGQTKRVALKQQTSTKERKISDTVEIDTVTDILEEQTNLSEAEITRTFTPKLAERLTPVSVVKAGVNQETKERSPSRSTKQALPSVLVVEVSNGAGRYRLAARTRRHFESRDLPVSYLTNAANYDNVTTVIFFKKGKRDLAEKFAVQLPISAKLEEYNDQYPHIRIRLGADVLDFDKEKLYATEIGAPNA